jgi:transposase-like protein
LARKCALLGATNAELADILDVNDSTIERWMREHREFGEAVRAGRQEADADVASRLYERATGYSHAEEKIFCNAGGQVTRVRTRRHYPPNTAAAIHWLKCRQPQVWRLAAQCVALPGSASSPIAVRDETKTELINSILNLVKPRPDPT